MPAAQRPLLDQIQEGNREVLDRVSMMLDLISLERTRSASVDLGTLVSSLVEDMQSSPHAASADLHFDRPERLVSVRGAQPALSKAAYYLLTGSLQATADSPLHVSVRGWETGAEVRVATPQPRVDPVVLHGAVRGQRSIGRDETSAAPAPPLERAVLRLRVAQHLARSLNGMLTVDAENGQHGVFTLRLPRLPEEP